MNSTQALLQPTTIDTAPEANREILNKVAAGMGFVPNMFALMANSEAVLQGYVALDSKFELSGFTPFERQAIFLATSQENECHYCVPAHSTVMLDLMKADPEKVRALRNHEPTGDAKLDALVALTRELVRNRGEADSATIRRFLDAGYQPVQVMEILVGLAMKTITNYSAKLSDLTLDEPFAKNR